MVAKPSTKATIEGHSLSSSGPSERSSCGTFSSSTRSVMATAYTPSEKASTRVVSFSSSLVVIVTHERLCAPGRLGVPAVDRLPRYAAERRRVGAGEVDLRRLLRQRRVGAVEFVGDLARDVAVGRDVGLVGEQVVEGGGVGVARVDGAHAEEERDRLVHRRHVVVDAG